VPEDGVIDTGADILIMGNEVFKKIAAAVAKLWKSLLKKANKTPHNYDQTPFSLNGRNVTFKGVTMCTPYISGLMLRSGLKLKYPLPFSVSYFQLITQQYKSRTV